MSDRPSIDDPALVALVRAFFDARTRGHLADLKNTLVAPSDGLELGGEFVSYAEGVQDAAESLLARPPDSSFVRLVAVEVLGPEPPPTAPDAAVYDATILVERGGDEHEEGLMVYRFGRTFKLGLALSDEGPGDGPPP